MTTNTKKNLLACLCGAALAPVAYAVLWLLLAL